MYSVNSIHKANGLMFKSINGPLKNVTKDRLSIKEEQQTQNS